MTIGDPLVEDSLLLVGFLLTSARGLADEPRAYGPGRLLDAASRLLAVMDEHGMLDEPLRAMRGRIEGSLAGPWEEEEFLNDLDGLAVAWIQLMAQRLQR